MPSVAIVVPVPHMIATRPRLPRTSATSRSIASSSTPAAAAARDKVKGAKRVAH